MSMLRSMKAKLGGSSSGSGGQAKGKAAGSGTPEARPAQPASTVPRGSAGTGPSRDGGEEAGGPTASTSGLDHREPFVATLEARREWYRGALRAGTLGPRSRSEASARRPAP
jgi:hypothetical protein